MMRKYKGAHRNISDWVLIFLVLGIVVLALVLYGTSNLFQKSAGNNEQEGNALKIPVLLEDQNPDPNAAEFILNAQTGQSEFVPGITTETLGYNGSYLGPVIRIRQGEKVNIHVNNNLGFPTTIHWHGLVVDGEQDGGPHQGIQSGESWSPGFTVDQSAATLWYHPHFIGNTADQVYYGLAGLIYVDDETSGKLNLPKDYGINDIPLIVQDRNFSKDGNFDYRVSMMGVEPGETILVNGTTEPFLEINHSKTRFRILNGSNSQNFEFGLSDGSSFQQIASDGGLLEAPFSRESLFLAPGERAEIIVDFSMTGSDTLSLMIGNVNALEFRLSRNMKGSAAIPDTLTKLEPITIGDNLKTRIFELQNMGINGTINGKSFDMNRIDEEINLNETEIWVVRNLGGMMQSDGHPFHVHGTQFRIISRDGTPPPSEEQGFKDTVYVPVGEEVRILVTFSHKGIFMYHCHILEHEDGGMMGQFRVQ
ncbi:MAG: multicopper oxidase domain-containing protein [Erysipelotrichaceae bacterium]|nr:multicopper oxidase domain-containing protein [Erysipelotrichaceae bacterium]